MDRATADLRQYEARTDAAERDWDLLTTREKAKRLAKYEQHPFARQILLAYCAHEEDEAELGRIISQVINDQIDEWY